MTLSKILETNRGQIAALVELHYNVIKDAVIESADIISAHEDKIAKHQVSLDALMEPEKCRVDSGIVQSYKKAREQNLDPVVESLQEVYDAALERQAERESLQAALTQPIDATVVVEPVSATQYKVFVPVHPEKEREGIMGAINQAVIEQAVQTNAAIGPIYQDHIILYSVNGNENFLTGIQTMEVEGVDLTVLVEQGPGFQQVTPPVEPVEEKQPTLYDDLKWDVEENGMHFAFWQKLKLFSNVTYTNFSVKVDRTADWSDDSKPLKGRTFNNKTYISKESLEAMFPAKEFFHSELARHYCTSRTFDAKEKFGITAEIDPTKAYEEMLKLEGHSDTYIRRDTLRNVMTTYLAGQILEHLEGDSISDQHAREIFHASKKNLKKFGQNNNLVEYGKFSRQKSLDFVRDRTYNGRVWH